MKLPIYMYSGPCDLRPFHLTVPSILRLTITDTTHIFSINVPLFQDQLQFETIFSWRNGWSLNGGTTVPLPNTPYWDTTVEQPLTELLD